VKAPILGGSSGSSARHGRLGAGEQCPLCGGRGGVTPDDDGFACILCGGPRILVDPPIVRAGAEKPFLERANRLRTRRRAWGVTAGVATAFGLFALAVSAVLALVMHLGANGGEIAAVMALGPLLFGAFGFSRVRRGTVEVREALAEAELSVVGEIARSRGGSVDSGDIARMLHVSPARAEELAAQAQVEGFLSSTDALPEGRFRVAEDAQTEQGLDPLEAERRDRAR
jgi:hypothetical protein